MDAPSTQKVRRIDRRVTLVYAAIFLASATTAFISLAAIRPIMGLLAEQSLWDEFVAAVFGGGVPWRLLSTIIKSYKTFNIALANAPSRPIAVEIYRRAMALSERLLEPAPIFAGFITKRSPILHSLDWWGVVLADDCLIRLTSYPPYRRGVRRLTHELTIPRSLRLDHQTVLLDWNSLRPYDNVISSVELVQSSVHLHQLAPVLYL